MPQLTPIEMKVFSRRKEVSESLRRRYTGPHYWLLWPVYGYLVSLSALFVLLEKLFGIEITMDGFWAWIDPPDKSPEDAENLVDDS